MSFQIHRRDTKLRFVTKFGENRPLRSCRKVTWFTKQKKWAPRESSQPFWPKWADRTQNVVTPWHVHVYRIWSGSAAFCWTYSRKIDFSAQKVNTIIGFHPTIIIPRRCLWCCHHGRAIVRVHPVYLTNIKRRQATADPRLSQMT